MEVGNDRQGRKRNNVRESFGGYLFVACAANNVSTSTSKRVDLLQRAFDIGRLGGRHRLDRDWRATADSNVANMQLAGCTSRISGLGGKLAHGEEVRATARDLRGPRHRDTAWTQRARP